MDVSSGSNALVQKSEYDIGQQDIATIRSNAAKRAYGYSVAGVQYAAESTLDKYKGDQAETAGDINALASLIGGSGSVSSKWMQTSNPLKVGRCDQANGRADETARGEMSEAGLSLVTPQHDGRGIAHSNSAAEGAMVATTVALVDAAMTHLQPPEDYPGKSLIGSAKWERPKLRLVVERLSEVEAKERRERAKDGGENEKR